MLKHIFSMKLPSFYIAPHHTQVVSAGRNEELAEFAKHRLDSRLHATQTSRRKAVPELKVWIMWLYTIFTSVVIIVVVILIFIVITICCYYYDSLLLLLLLLQLVGWFDLVWFGLIDWHRSINQSINQSIDQWLIEKRTGVAGWIANIACAYWIENGPLMIYDDLYTSQKWWCSIATLNCQRVNRNWFLI